MQRYEIMKRLGDGTYGSVWMGKNKENGELVAIKTLKRKFSTWDECITLREIKSLQSMPKNDNIVLIKELIREDDSQLHFVFEYMSDGNLYQLMKECIARRSNGSNPTAFSNHNRDVSCSDLTPDRIQSIVMQVLKGLEHTHSLGFIHRDIKPENLLLHGNVCKIADFGLARNPRSKRNSPALTEYISTRWYRAPEVLLRCPKYSAPIDVFAVGCVMAEMIELKPLFPGSSEIDQVHQVFSFLGQPTPFNWPEGVKLLKRMSIPLPDTDSSSQYSDDNGLRGNVSPSSSADLSKMNLIKAIPNANEGTISFLHRLLMMNPNVRPTAIEALDDPYFGVTQTIGQNDVTAPSRKRSAELHPFTECGAQNKSLTTPYLEGEVARQEKRNKSQNVQYDNLGQLSSLSAMNQFNCAQRATITPFDNQFNTGVQGTAGFQFKTSSMNTIDANSMHFGTTSSLNGCISQHNPFSLYDSFQ